MLAAMVRTPFPVEVRPIAIRNPLSPEVREPKSGAYMRAASLPVDAPQHLHQAIVAFGTDQLLLETALLPTSVPHHPKYLQMASLDHSIWFHRPCRADEWLLHAMESPSLAHGRGFALGRVFDPRGNLVASTAQDGLLRQVDRSRL
mmetsp:Transcript_1826/g.6704  ORF Transcript_1826/g.6704 Transcript_1826/m.6704 type:complete len:146 (+) Transcript_1826:448-885(+)